MDNKEVLSASRISKTSNRDNLESILEDVIEACNEYNVDLFEFEQYLNNYVARKYRKGDDIIKIFRFMAEMGKKERGEN